MSNYVVKLGSWSDLFADAKFIREHVFIQEQAINEADEWDEQDFFALHSVVYLQSHPIATARLLNDYSIGRVAVLKPYRGLHIGQKMMQALMTYADKQKWPYLKLSAQTHAVGFYQRLGFIPQGQIYDDCGIPHIDMFLMLPHSKK